jgi:predicted membrane protein
LVFGGGKTRRSLDEKKEREFKEVHNTLGDVVYSYGLIGGALFVSFIYFYFRTCSAVIYYVFVILSFLPLHVTHNMIRFRLMWIFYALVYSAGLLYLHSNKISVHSREMMQQRNPATINHNYAASAQKNA